MLSAAISLPKEGIVLTPHPATKSGHKERQYYSFTTAENDYVAQGRDFLTQGKGGAVRSERWFPLQDAATDHTSVNILDRS